MSPPELSPRIAALPKAELHLHLEGSIQPPTLRALMAGYGVQATEEEIRQRYRFGNFQGFLEAFKWVTSFLREPRDYALVLNDLGERLLEQNVVYAEVTLSVGVILLRKQNAEATFEALHRATETFERRGLRIRWIFDAVRQFGAEAAMAVVESAERCGSKAIVAFGIGGDEMSLSTAEFRAVYDRAAEIGLHRLIHAGEIGGPDKIREAIEFLGVERIGHGIAAMNDPALMDLLAERKIPLEICPHSNLRTGALALQLKRENAQIEDHPLPTFVRQGIPVTLATDDPAMFHTSLFREFSIARAIGLEMKEVVNVARSGFECAFLSPPEKQLLLDHFDAKAKAVGLL